MGWYYFSGTTTEPIPVGKGEVVAARPHSKLFIDASKESSPEVQRLKARGLLAACAWPKGAKKMVPEVVIPEPKPVATPATPFAEALVENPPKEVEVEAPVAESNPKKKVAKRKLRAAKAKKSTESEPTSSED